MRTTTRRLSAAVGSVALTVTIVGGVAGLAGTANAAKTKTCDSVTQSAGPGNSGMEQTVTVTQTSSCNSNSDTGYSESPGPVTNRGGGTPKGQQ